MEEPHSLEPPARNDVADPGAHQLAEASDSDDQFMDAQSIPGSSNRSSLSQEANADKENGEGSSEEASGPGPEMRDSTGIDRDDEETAVPPDFESTATTPKPDDTAPIPDDTIPIPLTVLKESTGDYPGQHSAQIQQHHIMDASPDIVLGPDYEVKAESRAQSIDSSPDASAEEGSQESPSEGDGNAIDTEDAPEDTADGELGDNFDDDFDDFEEGDGQDEDFDDFEDGFQEPEAQPAPFHAAPAMPPPLQQNQLSFSIPDFDGLSPDEVISSIDPCISNLFPHEDRDFPTFPALSKDSVFLTQRSASLWSQLVAPPPLAPPDWIRSHTRRLFLVSLGVPVDLDEILPASKQKKLVLPSLNVPSTTSRPSFDRRTSANRGKAQGSTSAAGAGAGAAAGSSEDQSKGQASSSRKKKGPPPEPELDLVTARHTCRTTDEALYGMTDQELMDHVASLEAMQDVAKDLLDYWTKRTDEKIGDREAFEGVIENLVAHARKVRK